MQSHEIPVVDFSGIGLSATLSEAVKLSQWKLEQRRQTWTRLSYLSVGVTAREEVPAPLPDLLREAELDCAVHLLEVNLVRPLQHQADRVRPLLKHIERLEPVCVEEDMGLWCWGQTELEDHMLPPIFDDEVARIVGRNGAELQASTGVPFLLENPPIYFDLGSLDLLTFMQRVAEYSDCGLVLDIGHLVGYCIATDRDPVEYLDGWSGIEHVRELHVAGFNLLPDSAGPPMWHDNHSAPIADESLELLAIVRELAGPLPITLEQEGASYGLIANHIDRVHERFGT